MKTTECYRLNSNRVLVSPRTLALWLTLALTSLLAACSPPTFKPTPMTKYSEASLQSGLRSQAVKTDQAQLGYVAIGNPEGIPVVFVHGTPGSWSSFRYALGNPELQQHFYMIAIDRLGWGNSSPLAADKATAKQMISSFEYQAAAISAIIDHAAGEKPVILVGHSLGASIAPRVALDYPDQIAGLMLIAGTLNPERGGPRWYNRFANIWPVSRMLSEPMSRANVEIMALEQELNELSKVWPTLAIPTTVIQGNKDKLVYPDNADYLQQQLAHLNNNLRIVRLDAGHFIPWEQTHIIEQELLKLRKQLIGEIEVRTAELQEAKSPKNNPTKQQ